MDFEAAGVKVLQPVIYLQLGRKHRIEALDGGRQGRSGSSKARRGARGRGRRGAPGAASSRAAGARRGGARRRSSPDEKAIVVVSRAYNGCDPGANLEIPQQAATRWACWCIPMDFLPLDAVALPEDWIEHVLALRAEDPLPPARSSPTTRACTRST